jgi:hypothetical protein
MRISVGIPKPRSALVTSLMSGIMTAW